MSPLELRTRAIVREVDWVAINATAGAPGKPMPRTAIRVDTAVAPTVLARSPHPGGQHVALVVLAVAHL
jgi:hypothetical protein